MRNKPGTGSERVKRCESPARAGAPPVDPSPHPRQTAHLCNHLDRAPSFAPAPPQTNPARRSPRVGAH
eukprot:11214540-Prorocentrum_lima.AAC.1